jgi:enoyl-CoA hydratase/carnithine racemase
MAESTEWMDDSLGQDDFKEGVASFVERRPARFAPILVEE